MGLKLHVRVLEARDLMAADSNGFSDPYVRLQLGSSKAKSSIVYKNLNPCWREDFFFSVDDPSTDILALSVWDYDFGFSDDFLGLLKIPLSSIWAAEGSSLPPTWFALQKRKPQSKVSGEIQLSLAIIGRLEGAASSVSSRSASLTRTSSESSIASSTSLGQVSDLPPPSPTTPTSTTTTKPFASGASPQRQSSINLSETSADIASDALSGAGSGLGGALSRVWSEASSALSRRISISGRAPPSPSSTTSSTAFQLDELQDGDPVPACFFQDDGKGVGPTAEMPPPLPGGIVLNQLYAVTAKTLHGILMDNGSPLMAAIHDAVKIRSLSETPWRIGPRGVSRTVVYSTPQSCMVNSTRAVETQVYELAGDGGYVILATAHLPDSPLGTFFQKHIQIAIFPAGPEGTESVTRLRVSWQVVFLNCPAAQQTAIHNGLKQGLSEAFTQFGAVIGRSVKPIAEKAPTRSPSTASAFSASGLDDDDDSSSQASHFVQYMDQAQRVASIAAAVLLVYNLLHIAVTPARPRRGVEILWLDLPDTMGELVVVWFMAAMLTSIAQREVMRLWKKLIRFGDHGLRARGQGWVLTATVVAAQRLPKTDVSGFSDPYVVLTCNGKTRNSSVKLNTMDPVWNEILEFDAFEDVPSTMLVEVFDYSGPFSDPELLGRAEVNFVKLTATELSDLWLPLEGRRARALGSQLHVRLFLNNSKGDYSDYSSPLSSPKLPQSEESDGPGSGPKLDPKSSAFQTLFGLPPHETLISDYSCSLKKKFQMQGRLYLSPRLLAFHSSVFGHRTTFYILWDDIEEIGERAGKRGLGLSSSTALEVVCRRGRASDAKAGSYGADNRGRLKFRFQSFAKASPAIRAVKTVWQDRSLPPAEMMSHLKAASRPSLDEGEETVDESSSAEDVEMVVAGEVELPIGLEQFLAVVENPTTDERRAAAGGQLNFMASEWEQVEDSRWRKQRRQVTFQYAPSHCSYSTKVTTVQTKYKALDMGRAALEELSTLHDVPWGEFFQVKVLKEVVSKSPNACVAKTSIGVIFHKRVLCQKRVKKSVIDFHTKANREFMDFLVQEVISTSMGT